jgi:uncharacterized protein YdhG (YjbR/CyaY superfamily)
MGLDPIKTAGRMPAMAATKTTGAKRGSAKSSENVWTDEERAAVQETARERKSAAKPGSAEEREQGELEVRTKIAEMPEPDRAMGERIHKLITKTVPSLAPKTYYGMPAWAKDGKVICFFKPASKFKVRYATFEFQTDARLDDGEMWPVSFAVTELTPGTEARIAELVKKAVS